MPADSIVLSAPSQPGNYTLAVYVSDDVANMTCSDVVIPWRVACAKSFTVIGQDAPLAGGAGYALRYSAVEKYAGELNNLTVVMADHKVYRAQGE